MEHPADMAILRGLNDFVSRQLGLVIAGGLLLVATSLIYSARRWSSNHVMDFYVGLFLNVGSGVLTMAVAIGLIDRLLTWRRKQEHNQSVRSATRFLLRSYATLASAHKHYLEVSNHPVDVLARYQDALGESIRLSSHLTSLIDEHQPKLADDLTDYYEQAGGLIKQIDEVKFAIRNGALDTDEQVQRALLASRELIVSTNRMSARISQVYPVPTQVQERTR
jgi:hypothetical protein